MPTFIQASIKILKELEIANKDPVKIARVQELSNISRTSEEDKELDTILMSYKGFPPRELQDPRLADKYWLHDMGILSQYICSNDIRECIEQLEELK